jgi:predicted O-linked N-acetylglucosamine transferase (SPINDLY family)
MIEHQMGILIDLIGHTDHNRMEILTLKPALLQVGYLGFLSSTGVDFMDYLIADTVVIPHGYTKFYSEKSFVLTKSNRFGNVCETTYQHNPCLMSGNL